MADGLVEIEEVPHRRLVVRMARNGAESVVLGNHRHIVLGIVLLQRTVLPGDELFLFITLKRRHMHYLVQLCTYAYILYVLIHTSLLI